MSGEKNKNCDFLGMGEDTQVSDIFHVVIFSSDDTENIESKLLRCIKRNYSAILIRNC